jgi:DNA-binding response OmpR family regulator
MPDPHAERQPTVLVVDDEPDLRHIICGILQRRGFTALPAGEANEAAAVCRDHDGPIDLLLTDIGLPGVPGGHLAGVLSAMRPTMRVLYISGWSRDLAVARGMVDERAAVFAKPFTSDSLVAAVTAALSDQPAELSSRQR